MEYIIAVVAHFIGIGIGFFIAKFIFNQSFQEYEMEAKAKAKAIEQEANSLLQDTKLKIKEEELKLKQKEESLLQKESSLEERERDLMSQRRVVEELKSRVDELRRRNEQKREELLNALEKVASMTKEEAKNLLIKEMENKLELELASRFRKRIKSAEESAEKRANEILAQATTRYAGEFAGERLINTVTLPSDEHKGRIIGKEGRNIKTLEQLLGVDIIIDDTPGVIVVSSFNLYRRAIATRVIELLVEDGRIHPARIEEIHEKVQKEFEQKIFEEGEKVVIDLGLYPMHEELIKLIGRLKYRASFGQNALAHSLEVARLAKVMAAEMGGDEKLALRAGLLHDIGKALTQDFGGSHVELGAEVCRKYNEHPIVINAIYAHHEHEEPQSIEAAAVCAADVLSSARPGARREVLESFAKRVKEIENIALEQEGVIQAYAINAGREVRVFVDAGVVDDDYAVFIAHKIAQEIEEKVQYPGEIKVTLIRQKRVVEYAR